MLGLPAQVGQCQQPRDSRLAGGEASTGLLDDTGQASHMGEGGTAPQRSLASQDLCLLSQTHGVTALGGELVGEHLGLVTGLVGGILSLGGSGLSLGEGLVGHLGAGLSCGGCTRG